MNLAALAVLLFVASFIVLLHQYVNWGTWFTPSDLHHETFAVALAFAGVVVLAVKHRRIALRWA